MAPFSVRQRVRFGETDAQQVVYYANYLVYAEVGRFAFFEHLGIDLAELNTRSLTFTIGEASVRYSAPLRFADDFDITVAVGEVRRASFTFDYQIDRADGLRCAKASTIQVIIDVGTRRSAAVPADVRAKLEAGRVRSTS